LIDSVEDDNQEIDEINNIEKMILVMNSLVSLSMV
jgi:hypothetical protein